MTGIESPGKEHMVVSLVGYEGREEGRGVVEGLADTSTCS
jgi:hypothetical protein